MKRKSGMPKATFGIRPHKPMTAEESEQARELALKQSISPEAIRQLKEKN